MTDPATSAATARTATTRPRPSGHVSDAFVDEILAHLLTAVTDEMAWIVLRSAYTTFVKETQDFATAILTLDGEVVAYPRNQGVTSMLGMPMAAGVKAFDDWQPGDIMICNDPYLTSGMVMHLNDVYVFKPVFVDGDLVCFAWSFIHFTDVGGAVPGSIDMRNTEIHQEGLRLRPVRLYRAGVRNEELWNIFQDNSRIPSLNEGDMDALVSAVNKAESRIHGLAQRYGVAALKRAMKAALDRTEQITRSVLAAIPEGEYRFVEYFEDDYVSDIPVRIEVCLRARGDGTVELDFTGSDPQVRSAINLPAGNQRHHPFLSRAMFNYVVTNAPDIHLNGGVLRCVDLTLPEASVVNAKFPVAIGMRAVTSVRSHDAVLGCLMQAVPDKVPAGGASQVAITYVSTSAAGEKGRVVVANPVLGGSGGSAYADGISGADRPLAFLRNVPVEVLETEAPVIVHRFGLVPDSEGPGEFRGGFGIRFELEVTHPEAVLVTRGKDRHRFTPWGARGGHAGTPGDAYERVDGERRYLGKTTVHQPELGAVVGIQGPGGGGFGDPLHRAPERVLADWRNGLVSLERARDVYGVVISDGRVDEEATRARRRDLATAKRPMFDVGAERAAWERRYGAVNDRIREWIWSLPQGLRWYAKRKAYEGLAERGDGPYSAEDIEAVIKEISGTLRAHVTAA